MTIISTENRSLCCEHFREDCFQLGLKMYSKADKSIFVVFLLLTVVISSVKSVTVSCRGGLFNTNYCLVSIDDPYATVVRTTEENSGLNCQLGVNFGFFYYSSDQAYVWATTGCGGTFEVKSKGSDNSWSEWGEWNQCSVTCGVGYQARTRTKGKCTTSSTSSNCASGIQSRSRLCTVESCNSVLVWNPWSDWSECSKSCGGGFRIRSRTCSKGLTYICTNIAGGVSSESNVCNYQNCPVNPRPGTGTEINGATDINSWSEWAEWNQCSVTCGVGYQARTRTKGKCTTSSTSSNCASGVQSTSRLCKNEPCKHLWNTWGDWSACTKTCGGGFRTRTRTCSKGLVNYCINTSGGSSSESEVCSSQNCPVSPGSESGKATGYNGACGMENKFGYRIIGGSRAEQCQFPWMVFIHNGYTRTICGGSILDETHILTAAHCLVSKQGITAPAYRVLVFSGNSEMPLRRFVPGTTRRTVSKVKVHENYGSKFIDNDIAIVTLTQPIKYDTCHSPVCLPSQSSAQPKNCRVMGWGKTSNNLFAPSSSHLLYTDVKMRDEYSCAREYLEHYDQRSKLCAGGGGQGSCSGDSGGPLLCQDSEGHHVQYGIVSAGREERCGISQGLYTRVKYFLDWIKANTQ